MNKNPFAIRKSPVEIIAAQAVALDDYVMLIPRGGRVSVRVKGTEGEGGNDAGPVNSCTTIF